MRRNAPLRRTTPLLPLCLALLACGSAPPPHGRVLLVGIDGASPRVVEPLLAEGRLPNLAALARDGVSGRLRSRLPLASPRIWNTIATGKRPEKHGITWFARKEGGRNELLISTDRMTHALWNIASDAGLRVGVVNFWNTFPPAIVDGIVVSDHLLPLDVEMRRSLSRSEPAPTGPTVYPEAWWARAQELVASADRVVEAPDPLGGLGPEIRQAAFRLRGRPKEDEALARIALAIEAEIHPALLMCLLPGIDRVSHVLWAGLEPPERYPPELRRPADERAAMAEALEAYYVFTDALIGALAARFGPDDLVVVVSDHGFEAGSPLEFLTGAHESAHAAEGVIFARGPGIPAGQPAGPIGIADVTPTVLAWLGLPVAEDMDGRPAAFLSGPAFETIPTYDTAAVARLPLAPSGAEGEILDQLRELGYLEQEPEAPRSGSSP